MNINYLKSRVFSKCINYFISHLFQLLTKENKVGRFKKAYVVKIMLFLNYTTADYVVFELFYSRLCCI